MERVDADAELARHLQRREQLQLAARTPTAAEIHLQAHIANALSQAVRSELSFPINFEQFTFIFPPGSGQPHFSRESEYDYYTRLAEEIGVVEVGVPAEVIDQFPRRPIGEGESFSCSICLGDGDDAMRLPCMHEYHTDCITHWLERSKRCPVCRGEVCS